MLEMQNRLREILKEKKMTMKEFAAKAGVSPQYISGICNGTLKVSQRQLERFADLLGVPFTEMVIAPSMEGIFCCPHCGKPIMVSKVLK